MVMPNFILIGAAKSGTTSLYYYLKQHPQIYMSKLKETNFFAYEGQELNFKWWGDRPDAILRSIVNKKEYLEQFTGVSNEKAIGEVSPLYLYCPAAPDRIKHYIPNVKLIAILRNPVDRAFSHFTHLLRDNREPCSNFAEALRQENIRMKENWTWDYFYKDMGFYYLQLKRYFDTFDEALIKVYLYDDMLQDMEWLLKDLFGFIDVKDDFVPETSYKYNVSGIPRSRVLHEFLSKPNPVKTVFKWFVPKSTRLRLRAKLGDNNLDKPKLSSNMRDELINIYRSDIIKLQKLINRDLSFWLI